MSANVSWYLSSFNLAFSAISLRLDAALCARNDTSTGGGGGGGGGLLPPDEHILTSFFRKYFLV
jgi:hypothetical protein